MKKIKIFHIFSLSLLGLLFSVFATATAEENFISSDPLLEILLDAGLELPENTIFQKNSSPKSAPIEALGFDEIEPIFLPIVEEKKCEIPAKIPSEIEEDFAKAIENIPCELLQSLRRIEIFQDPEGKFPRAMANSRLLKIREDAIHKPEFVHVLQHELGHIVDLGYLQSKNFSDSSGYMDGSITIYADDASVEFYKLSWDTDGNLKQGITKFDFVGGYAAGDMFEDFAESFLMYIEHGKEFRGLALENKILAQKYNFLKTFVFDGKEFESGFDYFDGEGRVWDVTKF